MAIKKVFKSPNKQAQSVMTLNEQDNTVTCQIFETWIVETDNLNTEPIDVYGATDGTTTLPIVSYSYSLGLSATHAYCRRVQPQRVKETPYAFECQVEYATPQMPPSTVKLNIAGVPFNEVVWYDKDNNALVNSRTKPFDPAQSQTFYDMKFGLSWQTTATPPVALIYAALGKVNSDSTTLAAGGWSQDFAERELKLEDAGLDFAFQGGQLMWTVSLSLLARSDTFITQVLDQGLDSNGLPILLDGHGNALASGATPVFLTFKIETEAPMSGIIATMP